MMEFPMKRQFFKISRWSTDSPRFLSRFGRRQFTSIRPQGHDFFFVFLDVIDREL